MNQDDKIVLEDGRKANRVVKEEVDPKTGEVKVITELWAEPKVSKILENRVIEYKKPVVHRREVEVHENGTLLQKTVEADKPEPRLEIREQVISSAAVPEPANDCYVTKEDLEDILQGLVREFREYKEESAQPAVQAVSKVEAMMAEKAETPTNWWDTFFLVVASAQVAALVYLIFFYKG